MPRLPMNYQNTVIYKIVCNDLNVKDIYVGHTTNFIKRKYQHKQCSNKLNYKGYGYKIYETIRQNGGWENWLMIEIEKYACNDINEATARERYWYEQLSANMNMKCPNRKTEEYKKETIYKEYCKQYNKIYKAENAEQTKVAVKEYYKNNVNKIKDYAKHYYETNIDKIKEHQSKKHLCSCGHYKSIYHQNYEKSKSQSSIL